MFDVMAVPAVILLVLLTTVPETPRWLLSVGRDQDGETSVLRLQAVSPASWRVQGRLRGGKRGSVDESGCGSRRHGRCRGRVRRTRRRRSRSACRTHAGAAVRVGWSAVPGRPATRHGNIHPVWTFAHVPNGNSGDATAAIIGQIERFAPGFRERILATAITTPAQQEAHNENYIGGDIVTGANTPVQVLIRPRFGANPYATGIPGVYICSAATPPGGGVHGMNGFNAARAALSSL